MPRYDAAHYSPPAAVARVALRNPDTGASAIDIELLIDSGADVTLLPRWAAARVGLQPVPGLQYELMGFDNVTRLASVIDGDMAFQDRTYRERYVLVETSDGVLGRDVLNHVILLLDGPKQEWAQWQSTKGGE
jgi:hypothetical protein